MHRELTDRGVSGVRDVAWHLVKWTFLEPRGVEHCTDVSFPFLQKLVLKTSIYRELTDCALFKRPRYGFANGGLDLMSSCWIHHPMNAGLILIFDAHTSINNAMHCACIHTPSLYPAQCIWNVSPSRRLPTDHDAAYYDA
jgi:hypothetical protein